MLRNSEKLRQTSENFEAAVFKKTCLFEIENPVFILKKYDCRIILLESKVLPTLQVLFFTFQCIDYDFENLWFLFSLNYSAWAKELNVLQITSQKFVTTLVLFWLNPLTLLERCTNTDLKTCPYVRSHIIIIPKNFVFFILRIFILFTSKVCEMFAYKHTKTMEYIKK